MSDKKTDLLPKDAKGALETLLSMRQSLAREFDNSDMERIDYSSYAPDIALAYAAALQADLELRRQIALEERGMPGAKKKHLRLNHK